MEQTLVERDKKAIWHPYTSQKITADPIAIVQGKGSYLIDSEGNRYIDAISSWWVNLHGHAHPYIAEKLYKQATTLEHVIFARFTHEPAIALAERLLNLLPGFSKIFYSDNGSTATEVSVKMSLQFWWNRGNQQRKKIIALKNGYHGDTFGAMSVSDRGIFTMAFEDKLFEVIFIDPNADPASLHKTHSFTWQEIACFIYEPLVQGAGGMKMYPATSLNELLRFIKEKKIICIADEVMTGFYRTGKRWASDYCEETPDIICLSKGLTGGTMPLGVTACNEEIYNAFVSSDKLKTFFHGHSFTANPLGCTSALASLDLLENEECRDRIKNIVQFNKNFISRLQSSPINHRSKNFRQLGTIIAFEMVTGEKDEYLNDISGIITAKSLQQGVYLRPLGNTVYIMPPYCTTEEELQEIYDAVEGLLAL